MAVTLLQLRTRIRQRSDNEHTGEFVQDSELNQLINNRIKELYELLVIHGLHRTESVQTISPTSVGGNPYALEADFFAMLGVWRVDPALGAIWLPRHDHRILPDTTKPGDAESYRVVGVSIEFNPVPTSGTYKVKYVPVPADLVADDDTIDGVLGWEEYVVVGCAIDVLTKEEAEEAALQSLRADLFRLHDRIKFAAQQVELSEHPSIASVRPSYFGERRLPGGFNVVGYRGPLW